MIVLRGFGCATGSAVQITTLLVGKLLFAGFEAQVVVSMDQAVPGRRAPLSFRAGLREGIAHRGQLIGHRAGGGLIDLGVREIELGDLEELYRDGAARWPGIAGAAATGDPEPPEQDDEHKDRGTRHPTVFGSAPVRVKEV